jgi:hypothetical protein
MKRNIIILYGLVVFLFSPLISMAMLTQYSDSAGHVVFDSVGEQYWYWDMSRFYEKTWDEQVQSVDDLASSAYAGFIDWHIASYDEMQDLWSNDSKDLLDNFYSHYSYTMGDEYHRSLIGRFDSVSTAGSHREAQLDSDESFNPTFSPVFYKVALGSYDRPDNYYGEIYSAFATATTRATSTVPEPTTMLLLGAGLVGLAGFGRKKLKK